MYDVGEDSSYEELFKRMDIMIRDYKYSVIQMLKTDEEEGLAKKELQFNAAPARVGL